MKRFRRLTVALFFALFLGIVGYFASIFLGRNEHTVIPGQFYRSAQPSETALPEMIAKHEIKTVLNLRGTAQMLDAPRNAWYAREARTTQQAGINQEDITLSASLLPPPAEIIRLVEILDRAERPVLIHCKQGADRTGLAAAMVVLLHTPGTLADARRELWPIYGHFPVGRTVAMDEFLDQYEAWLGTTQQPHTNDRFRQWATKIYTAGLASSVYTWLDVPKAPLKVGESAVLKLRAKNNSTQSWAFQPGHYSGVHLLYKVASDPTQELHRDHAGLIRRDVAPGETIDFDLVIPPIRTPGTYAVIAELIDARGCSIPIRSNSFVKLGDSLAMTNIEVR
ncbi:MAG: tyrosine-protein phosphatase [Fimbriiglobus sp.]